MDRKPSSKMRESPQSVYINSDVIFGLFHVLGYQFSPRLADVGEARFWRIDASADYGVLNGLARQTINRKLIQENWDDLLRVAGSLKLGTVNVTELLRALQGGGRLSTLAKAIAELGRIAKSLYLLSYIDDPAYRRRILIRPLPGWFVVLCLVIVLLAFVLHLLGSQLSTAFLCFDVCPPGGVHLGTGFWLPLAGFPLGAIGLAVAAASQRRTSLPAPPAASP